MEPSRELSRKAFVAGALFESSLIGVALLAGGVTDVAPLATFAPDPADAGIAVLATLPPLAFLFVFLRTPFPPLRRIRDALDQVFVPVFRGCTWDELLALALVAGVGEELVFRGWMQPWLTASAGPWAALVVASLAFGAVHAITPAYAVLATVIGLYLGGLQMATDNVLVPIVVHALYDFVAFLVLLRREPAGEPPDGSA